MVDDAVKNAKLDETKTGKEALVKGGELKAVEKSLADRIYSRVIDAGYYRPALGSAYYRPSYNMPMNYSPLAGGLYGDVTGLLGYHDYVNRYQMQHRVIGNVLDPALTEILGVMYDLTKKAEAKPEAAAAGDAKPAEAAKPAADAKAAALVQNAHGNLVALNAKNEQMAKLLAQGISEEALQKMVDAAIANKKNAPKEEDASSKSGQMGAVEKILADKIYNRIISDGYYRPPYTSSYYRPYYGPYNSNPLSAGLYGDLNRLLDYDRYVRGYENVNAVVGAVLDPKLEEILGVAHDLINGKKEGTKDATKEAAAKDATKEAAAKPAAKSLMQLGLEGVPVLVDPTLLENKVGEDVLDQRNYIIDGINGIDFVQTNDLQNEDLVVLHINGEARGINTNEEEESSLVQLENPTENPPMNNWSVNQPSPPHVQGYAKNIDLGMRDVLIDGVDGYDFVQLENPTENPPMNNWSVNQPSPPHSMGRPGKEALGFDMVVRGHKISVAQTSQSSENPTENPPMNNWSTNQPSPPHSQGLAGKEDIGLRDMTIDGINGYDVVQVKSENPTENPPMNNWSVNQPSPPHAQGMQGKATLGFDMVVRGHKISVAQNPTENPPMNNWSVHQPSRPHAQGMAGDEDLGMDMVVNGHGVHIAQKN